MIVIVDYHLGNSPAIANILQRIGRDAVISSDRRVIAGAEKLILPGVGAFDQGMKNLHDLDLIPALSELVLEKRIPILGICLGMQLFGMGSEEGFVPGLGWIAARNIKFNFNNMELKTRPPIPHIGWSPLRLVQPHSLTAGIKASFRFYFVHSFHLQCADDRLIYATAHYGYEFPAIIAHGNILGVQFHPEKSHRFGMELLKNFIGIES